MKKYENPDLRPEPLGVAEATRALKLPRRPPTEDDRPRRNGFKPHGIDGQMSVFDLLNDDGGRRR